jgi:hypothetical protein
MNNKPEFKISNLKYTYVGYTPIFPNIVFSSFAHSFYGRRFAFIIFSERHHKTVHQN